MDICTVNSCNKPPKHLNMCLMHYTRWHRYGDVNYIKQLRGENRTKHPLYSTYKNMHTRCKNPNFNQFKNYGGRGIKVCDRWSGVMGFSNFSKDMGDKPVGLTLERIDVNGNYEPANCKWATRKEQRANRQIKFNGPTHGKYTTYGNYRCRCDDCRKAHTDWHRLKRKRIKK